MLSFKDIQIIETSLDTVDLNEHDIENAAVDRVYNSLNDLLTSRFYNELKNSFSKLFAHNPIDSIRVKCSQSNMLFEPTSDFVKLKNHDLSLYLTQQHLGSLSDYIWKGRAIERLDQNLYRSDIFVGQKISSMIYKSFYKAAKPLIQPDDYRVNKAYREAILRLQLEEINFFVEVSFAHFKLKIHGHCLVGDEFLNTHYEGTRFDLALISV